MSLPSRDQQETDLRTSRPKGLLFLRTGFDMLGNVKWLVESNRHEVGEIAENLKKL